MDTKLKKRNPVATFLCYALAVSGLIVSICSIMVQWNSWLMAEDYKSTNAYHRVMGILLYQACDIAAGNALAEDAQQVDVLLEQERTNVSWYIQGSGEASKNGTTAQNAEEFLAEVRANNALGGEHTAWVPVAEQGEYAHLIVLDQSGIYEEKATRLGQTRSQASIARSDYADMLTPHLQQLLALTQSGEVKVYFAVRAEQRLDNTGSIYGVYYNWFKNMATVLWWALLAGVSLLVWVITILRIRTMRMAREGLAHFMGHIWLEIKLVLTALAIYVGVNLFVGGMMWDSMFFVFFLPCFWWGWLVVNDLRYNKGEFWRHNIVTSVTRAFRSLESRHSYLECRKQRAALVLCVETVLLALVLVAIVFASSLPVPVAAVCGVLVFVAFAVLAGYIVASIRGFDDFGKVADYAHEIRTGTATNALTLPEKSPLAATAHDLSCIHSGISSAVDERVRSEKMKAELVTNVSHDLKTPLTSIINYVDLLDKEDLSPAHANDYVDILAQKSQRLKNLVQDLFEVSKANSGAMEICTERIDVAALVEQTIAEMDARAESTGVEVKTQFAAPRIYAMADGRQIHRVLENLLGNALKYSLPGTRVYITAQEVQGGAEISFKNVAGYEMDFSEKDIVERFQRGDASRATEGSGLGLAIAKSFVELNRGALHIDIDGDLFRVVVFLPMGTPAVASVPLIETVEAMPAQVETEAVLAVAEQPAPTHMVAALTAEQPTPQAEPQREKEVEAVAAAIEQPTSEAVQEPTFSLHEVLTIEPPVSEATVQAELPETEPVAIITETATDPNTAEKREGAEASV